MYFFVSVVCIQVEVSVSG